MRAQKPNGQRRANERGGRTDGKKAKPRAKHGGGNFHKGCPTQCWDCRPPPPPLARHAVNSTNSVHILTPPSCARTSDMHVPPRLGCHRKSAEGARIRSGFTSFSCCCCRMVGRPTVGDTLTKKPPQAEGKKERGRKGEKKPSL